MILDRACRCGLAGLLALLALTIRQALGLELVVSRSQIAIMLALKLSLMPDGLEEGLTNQDLADLVDFIVADVH
jgi:hypothetical protein